VFLDESNVVLARLQIWWKHCFVRVHNE
jgi:hypothetical protein